MDRNGLLPLMYPLKYGVALRKESVDRNFHAMQVVIIVMVALRKESVDRNLNCNYSLELFKRSLSARRAWIEIYNLSDIEDKFGGRSPQGERG